MSETVDYFAAMRAAPKTLVEIDAEHAAHMLEVLPPVYGDGCFAMGDPYSYDHEAKDQTFYWAGKVGDGWLGFLGTKTQAEEAFASRRAA